MTDINRPIGHSEASFSGPMVGGVTVNLGEFQAMDGKSYVIWLQFGGEVRTSASSASKVNGKWIKNPPPPPSKSPLVTVVPLGGGPRSSYEAAVVVDLARCAAPFVIADPWDRDDCAVQFQPNAVERLGAAIEASIPPSAGLFSTQWVPAGTGLDDLPF